MFLPYWDIGHQEGLGQNKAIYVCSWFTKKLSNICLETPEMGVKSKCAAYGQEDGFLKAPLPTPLGYCRSQFTLTFSKQMEGGAGKGLALKEEISAVWSHKIPRAWEHSDAWNCKNKRW